MHASIVDRYQNEVMTEEVGGSCPSSDTGVSNTGEVSKEERAEGGDSKHVGAFSRTMGYELEVEIDHNIIEPSIASQSVDVSQSDFYSKAFTLYKHCVQIITGFSEHTLNFFLLFTC